jgi:hypothetical protein
MSIELITALKETVSIRDFAIASLTTCLLKPLGKCSPRGLLKPLGKCSHRGLTLRF